MKYLPLNELNSLDIEKYLELSRDLSVINKDNIQGELSNSTVVFSYYHGLLVHQKRRLDGLVNNAQAFYSLTKNSELLNNKSKGAKATATYLEDFVQSNEEYISFKKQVIEQEEIYGYLKALCGALEHKKDMLVQLSANLRSETKLYN
tara:strand:- start:14268 stop:14711 length:444 start_codon:yes stop_codon:yes gene_type:complete